MTLPKPRQPNRRSPEQRRSRARKERLPHETPDTPWRLFVAVPIPDAVREQIAAMIAHVQRANLPARWIDAANGHMTLHFIGETEPELAELLRMAMAAPIAPHAPFELRTAEPGAFPTIRRPRVIWLGLWGPAHRLESLYNDIGDFLDDFGLEVEDADFHPHITVGRIRTGEGVRIGELPEHIRLAFDSLIESGIVGKHRQVQLPVTEVQLIRSHLSADGARYEVLGTYRLEGTE